MKTGLVIVDYQKDFISGKLSIPYSDTILKRMKNMNDFDLICTTMNVNKKVDVKEKSRVTISDTNHYCIEGTDGIKLHDDIDGKYPTFIRSYENNLSAINAKDSNDKSLLDFIKENEITDVFLCGLPADYSIKFTALDFINNDMKVYVVIDCIKTLGNISDFLKIVDKGVNFITSDDVTFFLNAKKAKMGDKLIDPMSKIKKTSSKKSRPWEGYPTSQPHDRPIHDFGIDDREVINRLYDYGTGGWYGDTSRGGGQEMDSPDTEDDTSDDRIDRPPQYRHALKRIDMLDPVRNRG